jgi:hypothetical protein
MEEKATSHMRSVCSETACRAGVSARKSEERVPGNKMSIIAKHGDPEPRISDNSLSGIRHLSRMRLKRKGLTGTSAMG